MTEHRAGMSAKPGNPKYRCTFCRRWFLRPQTAVSCCVLHAAGDCCHTFEVEVTRKGWVKPLTQQTFSPAVVIRPYSGPTVSGSSTSAPWCGICAGFHIPGAGPCTGTYS